jgi:uncharacterized protein
MTREGLLDLNEAVQHPGKKLVFDVRTELQHEEDIDLLEPVTGQLQAISTGNLLLVDAQLSTRAVLECARCSAPIELDVEFEMSDQFLVEGLPSAYSHEGFAKVVTDEPEPMFQGNALILDHYVRQGLLLNMPAQPICSASWDGPCKGDVPVTSGTGKPGHPAFEALMKLKEESSE